MTQRFSASESVLAALHPEESAVVLALLASACSELAEEAAELAVALLDEVDCQEVADQVESLVRSVDQFDLYEGAGRTASGWYVHPAEAAWRNLDELAGPLVGDIERRAAAGLEEAALEFCKGVVLGLYRVEHGPPCDARDHVPDWPTETACEAVRIWRVTRRPSRGSVSSRRSLPRAFVQECVPKWGEMLGRP